jgi:hypothetical protein
MGQAFGRPQAHADVKPFTNLPKEAVQSLWTSYNLHGEGWGLELFDFMVIFKEAAYFMSLGFTEAQLEALFNTFDTDSNGLVDALEMIISLVLASGKFREFHVFWKRKKKVDLPSTGWCAVPVQSILTLSSFPLTLSIMIITN